MSALPRPSAESLQALDQAFQRFQSASQVLQQRHERLQREIEDLKSQLAEKEEEVQRAHRLASLGETAAAIAHEVRNPLGSMTLFLSLLRREVREVPKAKELVEQMQKSIASLDQVVSNILQFARNKNLTVAPLNIHAIIQEQVASVAQMQSTAHLELELSANPFLLGNEAALRQVIANLLQNSLQATANHGRIVVSTVDTAEGIEVTVRDNGPGFDPCSIEKLFTPFFTTKSDGTGLGLAIVQQIVQQHGGSITAENRDGACFIVNLPRSQGARRIQENRADLRSSFVAPSMKSRAS